MSPQARWEYMKTIHERYAQAKGKREKGAILDEFCKTYGCHRKHALRALNRPAPGPRRAACQPRQSPYNGKRLLSLLEAVWKASGYPCGQRLKFTLLEWMSIARTELRITAPEERLLRRISPATIDRRLKPQKRQALRRIYGQTRPGHILKHHIPIKTDCWDVDRPGYTEVDLVAHCGDCGEGYFANTLTQADVFTGWVERRCVLGKSEIVVCSAVDDMRGELPFDLLGVDSDNGSEFINHHLWRYCQGDPAKKRTAIQMTRGRPYKKDDNAHVEQKNWTHVRKPLGYGRFDTQPAVDAINDLYRRELRWFQNLFLPSMKLIAKVRVGSKLRRRYDTPKTPFQRVLDSGRGDQAKIAALRRLRDRLNPFELSRIIDRKLERIWAMRSPAPKPQWLHGKPGAFAMDRPFIGPPHPIDSPTFDRFERLKAKETALLTW
ncbi:MAG: hypothetical protein Q8M19_15305 [Reyranella sp.]|nr:hypothetical protein [Reyranella sp.]MDP3542101.1 integrase [Elusimicrobiota bacterium]